MELQLAEYGAKLQLQHHKQRIKLYIILFMGALYDIKAIEWLWYAWDL